ncbi:MAG: hypothetical protein GXY80_14165, partial [Syntrophorhabdus aromaticivorans]|nr:hypothetical protein [Syntrophorhabdus aromaticivorans]
SFANSGLVPDYLDLHAYDNWRDLGTRYGFTRYSGTCLAVASKSEVLSGGQKPFSYGTLYTHFETIYYEVALLVFFHRATLVRFSKDAADCAELFREARAMQDSERKGRAFERARDLRGEFLLFHNKYWFTEITNQDQGIDMFNRWETALRNKQLFEEVKQELSELNEYIEREHAGNLDLLVGGLTVLAAAGLILTIWLSFLGANIPSIEEWFRLHDSAAAFLAKLFLAVCTFFTLGAIAALIPDFRSKFFGVIENFVRNLK